MMDKKPERLERHCINLKKTSEAENPKRVGGWMKSNLGPCGRWKGERKAKKRNRNENS